MDAINEPPPSLRTLPLPGVPAPATVIHDTSTTTTATTAVGPSGWLHTNLRNLLGIGIVGMVCWMAWEGDVQARSGIIAAFSVLIGMIWGERAALKKPGQDS